MTIKSIFCLGEVKGANEVKELIMNMKRQGLKQLEIAKVLGISEYKIYTLSKQLNIRWDRGAQLNNKNAEVTGLGRTTIARLTRRVITEANRCLFTCERCLIRFPEEIHRHHKDRDRSNNNSTNLELLCGSCHALEHGNEHIRDNITGRFVS